MWRNTPHGRAYVPPQPQDPMRHISEALAKVLEKLAKEATCA